MKAISIRQPWAWAILSAGKTIENRSWPTSYRGPILIHAAKGLTKDEHKDFCQWYDETFRPTWSPPALTDLHRGGIVGKANLIDCIKVSNDPWFFGPYGFVLANVEPLPFVSLKGALGLFDVPVDGFGKPLELAIGA